MDYYKGNLGKSRNEMGIILSPFESMVNTLTILIHEGVHALDDSYMRIHQNKIIDYLAKLDKETCLDIPNLLHDAQAIIRSKDFIRDYNYNNFFKNCITIVMKFTG